MFRKHENSVAWKAGTLSIVVHLVLLGALLISFNWKAAHQVINVTEVELWDSLPTKNEPKPVAKVEPKPEPKPIVKPEPKPEPPKPVVEEKPKPEEPKVDIELEKKKQEAEQKKRLEEKRKLEDARKKEELEKLKRAMREEELKQKKVAQPDNEALKKIQQELLNENNAEPQAQTSAVSSSVIDEYTSKIQAKIRGNVNKTLCGDGNPELRFDIGLLPTGELNGNPKLVKSSGNAICDEAVERAIIASEPLPLPSEQAALAKFRNLKLKFRPNDN